LLRLSGVRHATILLAWAISRTQKEDEMKLTQKEWRVLVHLFDVYLAAPKLSNDQAVAKNLLQRFRLELKIPASELGRRAG
jgi:hypothetical protein